MKIKRLFIGDFGILRNQTLDDLAPGIVVVGGKNRAGKSTFMKVLSHLGSGFVRNKGLPPPTSRYLVESDILPAGDEQISTLRIEGRSAPVLTLPPGKSYTIEELFPDPFSYQHLYTISLDELMKKPESLDNKDISKLQSVILGGGYNDIANIIELEKTFTKEADKFGGKRGSARFRTFKPLIEKIDEALDEKEMALAQLDEYKSISDEIESLHTQMKECEQSKDKLDAELDILEALRNSYDDISEIKKIETLLEDHGGNNIPADFPYDKLGLVEDYHNRYKDIEQNKDKLYYSIENKPEASVDTEGTIKRVIASKDRIEEASHNLPAINEKLSSLKTLESKVRENKRSISDRIKGLGLINSEDELSRIESLTLDIMTESQILGIAQATNNIQEKQKELTEQRDELVDEGEKLLIAKRKIKSTPIATLLRSYIFIFIISVILGAALFVFNQLAGAIAGALGIIGSVLYVVLKYSRQKEARKSEQNISAELEHIESKLKDLDPEIDKVNKEGIDIADKLHAIKQTLGCSKDFDPDTTLKYYNSLKGLQDSIRSYNNEKKDYEKSLDSVNGEILKISKLLDELSIARAVDEHESMFESAAATLEDEQYDSAKIDDSAFKKIEAEVSKWQELSKEASEHDSLESELASQGKKLCKLMGIHTDDTPGATSIEEQVAEFTRMSNIKNNYIELVEKKDLLNANIERLVGTERIKNAANLIGYYQDGKVAKYLFNRYDRYITSNELDEEYSSKQDELNSLRNELNELTKKIQTASDKMRRLEENAQLEAAHRKVDASRGELRPLANRYAMLRAASFMCKDIKNKFLEEMREELLGPARKMLSDLTGGEYNGITPDDDFSKLDYSFTLSDGSSQESVDILSRGTREQVFLAVRLGRIIDSKPAPVIIDDSFVNFDTGHLTQALGLLGKLSRTHQVFIMTCHPHLVSQIAESEASPQYWQLERGSFSLSDAKGLIKHLGN